MENKRKAISLRDAVIIVCIISAAVGAMLIPRIFGGGEYAVITCGGETVAEIPLTADGEYTYPEAEGMIFCIEGGCISVKKSGCKNQICVNTPKISCVGEVIVCMPNKAAVEIAGDAQDNEVDVILR